MTIAGVYLSPEGVVIGADSTSSTVSGSGAFHFFDFNQKVFQIGEDSTLGIVTWGMAGGIDFSHRTLIARFADDLKVNPATSVLEVATRWTDWFWATHSASVSFQRHGLLAGKSPHIPTAKTAAANARTEAEEKEFTVLTRALGVGFCIGGYVLPDRAPAAISVTFAPGQPKPTPQPMQLNSLQWWGVPNYFVRLLKGADDALIQAIASSGKWNGTAVELANLVSTHTIQPPGVLPIRDAVDYVHTCIVCTIKALKFSNLPQLCGGPIEIAVITSDRKFRWVKHKPWDAAILDGVLT